MTACREDNIVLIGMMGAGKGAVAAALGRLLDRPVVDTDELVEAETGTEVAELFAAVGEGRFRLLERRTVRGLTGLRGAVVSTGGGIVLAPANRRALRRLGAVVWLTCGPEELATRTGAGTPAAGTRPLIAGLERAAAIERLRSLAAAREPLYAALADAKLDTAGLTAGQTATRICGLLGIACPGPAGRPGGRPAPAGRRAGEIATAAPHPVFCSPGLLRGRAWLAGDWARRGRQALLVSDPLVQALYGSLVLDAARRAGLEVEVACVPRGEAAKSPRVLVGLHRRMLGMGLDRDGLVLALGGGAVGDVAGFAAATYLRGIAHVQLPTTLLAQADSALGGKTAIDLDGVKNPVGAFHHPVALVADVGVLRTLPQAEIRSGLAEVLKHGLCLDERLWSRALALDAVGGPTGSGLADPARAVELVASCLSFKAGIVAGDEREAGPRAVLNFGHTLGHALEGAAGGRLRHGEAVALGIDFAVQLGEELGITRQGTASEVRAGLASAGLGPRPRRRPSRGRSRTASGPGIAVPQVDASELLSLLSRDKKATGGRHRLVLLRRIGEAEPGRVEVPAARLERALGEWLAAVSGRPAKEAGR